MATRRLTVPGWAKWLIPAVAIVIAGAIITTLIVARTHDGPLTVGTPGVWEGAVEKPDQTFGWGTNLVVNRGERPARLLKVELIPMSGTDTNQLAQVGARAFAPNKNGTVAFPSWPDKQDGMSDSTTEPLDGYVIPPGKDAWIVLLLKVRKPGYSHWTGLTLTYQVDNKTYTTESSNGLTICTAGPHCKLPDHVTSNK
jgi:hypothetical protein